MSDELVKAALDAIAATAAPPERVRGRITARARFHRQRRQILVGVGALGGAAAATAVGIPLFNGLGRESPAEVAAPSTAAPSTAAPSEIVEGGAPLYYSPGSVPAGLVERCRQVTYGTENGSRRYWLPEGVDFPENHDLPPGICLVVGEAFTEDGTGQPVTIGQVPGRLFTNADPTRVTWIAPGGPVLTVQASGLPNAAEVVLQVARSVRPTDAKVLVAVHPAKLPERYRGLTQYSVHVRPDGWMAALTSMSSDRTRGCTVNATKGRGPDRFLARATRAGGITLWVPDEQDPSANLTADEARTVLESTKLSEVDMRWAGAI
ncbi:hypothetical protein [Dactylosporangium sp. NPDC051541]|uniref:hypothetical protein n=1 Tax=Dactylosporangium sp. NPDC051541 TaxID=3363977 RepID=UPI00379EFCE8